MNKNSLILCLLVLCIGSCKNDSSDCSMVLCAPNDAIVLELISNGENVISNRTYTEENIDITGEFTENLRIRVLPDVQGGTTTGLLEFSNFDWQPGEYRYTLMLGEDWVIDIAAIFSLSEDYPCCGRHLNLTDLSAADFSAERRTYSSYYTVILE